MGPSPEANLQNESQWSRIAELLEALDERESTILRLRYGLNGEGPMTLKQIGTHVNLTRERVRQIEWEALQKIKEHIIA